MNKKLYTAIGRYESRKNEFENRYPVIIIGEQEYLPDTHEMIIWTCLNWHILTIPQIRDIYMSKCNKFGLEAKDFEVITESLVRKGFVEFGTGETEEDALYDLFGDLYITTPTAYNIFVKILSYLKLTLKNGVSFRKALSIFRKDKYTGDEKRVMDIAKQTALTTAEIIKCVEEGAYDVSTDNKILDVLYSDQDTTCDNISSIAKLYQSQEQVLTAIANLYLRKQIILQRI